MSVTIRFNNVTKRYGDYTVISDLSLEVKKGEFFTLLGPSGCGKTTLLRTVAGFINVDRGEIKFNEKIINNVAPKSRNVGMVFQNYAIFPHMTVKENIAFGLNNQKISKLDVEKRVEDILHVVKMHEYKDRLPDKLSGGQQQRVALARAIVIEPNVLLMDEPLSNLDAKLRIEMRNAIKDLQNKIGITTIYVTHDQEEAMAVSDRIGIMKSGVIQQVGTPRDIYHRPDNIFVATFIGQTNIIDCQLAFDNDKVFLEFTPSYREVIDFVNIDHEHRAIIPVKVSVRPEEFIISGDGSGVKASIINSIFLGPNTHYFLRLETGSKVEIIKESMEQDPLKTGMEIYIKVKKEKINIYDEDTDRNVTKEVVKNDY